MGTLYLIRFSNINETYSRVFKSRCIYNVNNHLVNIDSIKFTDQLLSDVVVKYYNCL